MKEAHGFLWPHGAEAYGRRYIAHAADMKTALKFTTRRRTVVQAGGHVGVWPWWLSGHFANVVTFEPEPANYEALVRNLEAHAVANVRSFPAGLGAASGRAGLSFNSKNIGGHKLRPGEGDTLVVSIDEQGLSDVDLIVLDVEGWEFPALEGARATIERSRPVIMLEDRGHAERFGFGGLPEILTMLEPLGYRERARVAHDVVLSC